MIFKLYISLVYKEFNFIGGIISGALNYSESKENRLQNRQLQHQAWAREDNAVQRRVKDLEAAGFNKILAAGQPASSMAPIQTQAPQLDVGNPIQGVTNVMRQEADIARTNAQHDLLLKQWEKTNADKYLSQQKAEEIRYNTDRAKRLGISTQFSGKSLGANILNALDSIFGKDPNGSKGSVKSNIIGRKILNSIPSFRDFYLPHTPKIKK